MIDKSQVKIKTNLYDIKEKEKNGFIFREYCMIITIEIDGEEKDFLSIVKDYGPKKQLPR